MSLLRVVVGHLLFALSLVIGTLAAMAFGPRHEMGLWTGFIVEPVWRYPAIWKAGVVGLTAVFALALVLAGIVTFDG